MKVAIAVAALTLVLSGCGVGNATDSSSNLQQELDHKVNHMKDTEPFWPAYVAMLQGKQPFPSNNAQCPPAKDLKTLMVPCDSMKPDQGGKP